MERLALYGCVSNLKMDEGWRTTQEAEENEQQQDEEEEEDILIITSSNHPMEDRWFLCVCVSLSLGVASRTKKEFFSLKSH